MAEPTGSFAGKPVATRAQSDHARFNAFLTAYRPALRRRAASGLRRQLPELGWGRLGRYRWCGQPVHPVTEPGGAQLAGSLARTWEFVTVAVTGPVSKMPPPALPATLPMNWEAVAVQVSPPGSSVLSL